MERKIHSTTLPRAADSKRAPAREGRPRPHGAAVSDRKRKPTAGSSASAPSKPSPTHEDGVVPGPKVPKKAFVWIGIEPTPAQEDLLRRRIPDLEYQVTDYPKHHSHACGAIERIWTELKAVETLRNIVRDHPEDKRTIIDVGGCAHRHAHYRRSDVHVCAMTVDRFDYIRHYGRPRAMLNSCDHVAPCECFARAGASMTVHVYDIEALTILRCVHATSSGAHIHVAYDYTSPGDIRGAHYDGETRWSVDPIARTVISQPAGGSPYNHKLDDWLTQLNYFEAEVKSGENTAVLAMEWQASETIGYTTHWRFQRCARRAPLPLRPLPFEAAICDPHDWGRYSVGDPTAHDIPVKARIGVLSVPSAIVMSMGPLVAVIGSGTQRMVAPKFLLGEAIYMMAGKPRTEASWRILEAGIRKKLKSVDMTGTEKAEALLACQHLAFCATLDDENALMSHMLTANAVALKSHQQTALLRDPYRHVDPAMVVSALLLAAAVLFVVPSSLPTLVATLTQRVYDGTAFAWDLVARIATLTLAPATALVVWGPGPSCYFIATAALYLAYLWTDIRLNYGATFVLAQLLRPDHFALFVAPYCEERDKRRSRAYAAALIAWECWRDGLYKGPLHLAFMALPMPFGVLVHTVYNYGAYLNNTQLAYGSGVALWPWVVLLVLVINFCWRAAPVLLKGGKLRGFKWRQVSEPPHHMWPRLYGYSTLPLGSRWVPQPDITVDNLPAPYRKFARVEETERPVLGHKEACVEVLGWAYRHRGPTANASNSDNELNCLNRILGVAPGIAPDYAILKRAWVNHYRDVLFDLRRWKGKWPQLVPLEEDAWIATQKDRATLLYARSLLQHNPKALSSLFRRSIFIKREVALSDTVEGRNPKDNRGIQGAQPEWRLQVGPAAAAFQSWLKLAWNADWWIVFLCGLPAEAIGYAFQRARRLGLGDDDISRMDMCVDPTDDEMMIDIISWLGLGQHAPYDLTVAQLHRGMINVNAMTASGTYVFSPGGRRSGDPTTTSFNTPLPMLGYAFDFCMARRTDPVRILEAYQRQVATESRLLLMGCGDDQLRAEGPCQRFYGVPYGIACPPVGRPQDGKTAVDTLVAQTTHREQKSGVALAKQRPLMQNVPPLFTIEYRQDDAKTMDVAGFSLARGFKAKPNQRENWFTVELLSSRFYPVRGQNGVEYVLGPKPGRCLPKLLVALDRPANLSPDDYICGVLSSLDKVASYTPVLRVVHRILRDRLAGHECKKVWVPPRYAHQYNASKTHELSEPEAALQFQEVYGVTLEYAERAIFDDLSGAPLGTVVDSPVMELLSAVDVQD